MDPFTSWTRLMTATAGAGQTAWRGAETLAASAEVVASRSQTIGTAFQSPLDGDYAELARMLPEKVEAFSRAGSAMTRAWWGMQSAWTAEAQHLGQMMLSGRPPSLVELAELGARGPAYGLAAVEAVARAGAEALAPIHRSATANARRLRRSPRKRRG